MKPQPSLATEPSPNLPLDAFLPYRLVTAGNAVSRLIARAYDDRFGLSVPEWRVMCVLAESGPVNLNAVAARLLMDRSHVARAAQGLLKRRLAHVAEPRGRLLALTAEGLGLHGEIAPLALAYEAALIAGLAPGEVALLKRLLNRLQAAALTLAGQANDGGEAAES
jgi:DNA-binding MarR family transcriptional regulator